MTASTSVSKLTPRRRAVSLSLLAISFLCNVAALLTPFMLLRRGLSNEPYSLFHSVSMLWGKGLYAIAILVVAFSVCFPFAKLGVLARVALAGSLSKPLLKSLAWVERLGKWSMLDVFLVSIILSLASNQFLVGARPLVGLNLFIIAILLSMTAGEILFRGVVPRDQEETRRTSLASAAWLVLSLLTLLAALAIPFLRIDDWLLADHEYSIASLGPALWSQGAQLAAALTACFLVFAPLAVWTAGLWSWLKGRQEEDRSHANRIRRLAQRWNMLDVFGLALVVFALESDELMATEIRWGALFLGLSLALQIAFQFGLDRAIQPAKKQPQAS